MATDNTHSLGSLPATNSASRAAMSPVSMARKASDSAGGRLERERSIELRLRRRKRPGLLSPLDAEVALDGVEGSGNDRLVMGDKGAAVTGSSNSGIVVGVNRAEQAAAKP